MGKKNKKTDNMEEKPKEVESSGGCTSVSVEEE